MVVIATGLDLLSYSVCIFLSSASLYILHNLVNDLATVISGKSCWRLECGGKASGNVRHLSYNQERYDNFKKFEILYDFKCLRSFLPTCIQLEEYMFLSRKVVNDFLPTLKRLRILSLSKYSNITMLPDSIGNLIQLWYLDLSHTGIKRLPDATCNLYNLQTLILTCCENLTKLPINIGKLVCLRHLYINETNIEELPVQILGLENLQTLTYFVVGKQQVGLSIKDLKKFKHLEGDVSILNLHNISDAMEVYDANLKSKEQIETLLLEWGTETEDSQLEKVVLDALQPTINLKMLGISFYGGTSFPSWLGDSSFSNMVRLRIHNCKFCVTLPPLGRLLSLKELWIDGMMILETIGSEFYGMDGGGSNSSFQPFSSLQYLKFENMPSWKEWLPFEGNKLPFPHLITLGLHQCPELRGHLPSHLSSIEEFSITDCDNLLAAPCTKHWLSSIKRIYVQGDSLFEGTTERTQWLLLDSDSPCVLQKASIDCCHKLLYVPKMILSSTCLQHLELSRISSLTAFPDIGLPTSLCSLKITDCENLSFLPPETWSNYKSLVTLELVNSCHTLKIFPLDGFPALETLKISKCRSLESICISESCCSPRASTLESLRVDSCNALLSLPQQMDTFTTLCVGSHALSCTKISAIGHPHCS